MGNVLRDNEKLVERANEAQKKARRMLDESKEALFGADPNAVPDPIESELHLLLTGRT